MTAPDNSWAWTGAAVADALQQRVDREFDDERFRVTEILLSRPAGKLFASTRRKLTVDGRPVIVRRPDENFVRGCDIDQVRLQGFKRGKKTFKWVYLIPDGCEEDLYIGLRTRSGLGEREADEAARLLA